LSGEVVFCARVARLAIVVACEVRRHGMCQQLVQRAILMSRVGVVAAEVNQTTIAVQALFQGLGFMMVRSTDWVVCRVPSEG
jgi:hypothetical protein